MKKLCLLTATLGVTLFIWYHSLQAAPISAGYSGFFVELLKPWLAKMSLTWNEMDHIVRKTAHFTEFAVWGFFLRRLTVASRRLSPWGLKITLALGLAVAATDEGIQTFSPGRSTEIRDVALDFAGVTTGALLAAWRINSLGPRRR